MAKDAVTHDLTPRQIELLICVCKSLNAKPTSLVNIEKFAELGGFANLNSARANLHAVLNKVKDSGGAAAEGDGGDGEGKKAVSKKRGRRVTKEDGDGGEEAPAKKTKGTANRGKKVSKADGSEEGGEGEKIKDEDGDGEGEDGEEA